MNFRVSLWLLACFLVLLLISSSARAQQASASGKGSADIEARLAKLQSLFDEEWQYELRSDPESATSLGDKRYNDRLSDHSPQFHQSDVETKRKFLAQFEAIDPAGLSAQDALSRDLMVRNLREEIEGARFKPWEMPVNQMGGPHLNLLELLSLTPFNDVHDYDNYLSRLHQIPKMFDQVTANMRQGMQDHLMPPRYLLEKVTVEAEEIADKTGDASPFAKPVANFPANVSSADQQRLRSAVLATIDGEVVPAYKRFTAFARDEYAPHGRIEPGVWALADGAARYRSEIRRLTTTDLSPEQIHQIGLQQIAETEAQMLVLARKLGFSDLASLNDHIKKDRSLYATSGQQVLDLYTKYTRQMEAQLPKLFGRLPQNKLELIPMDPFPRQECGPRRLQLGSS